MAEKFSFLFLSSSGRIIKRGHCAYWIFYGLLSVPILLTLAVAVGVSDYVRLSRKDLTKASLEAELALHKQEVIHHRKQIQKFATEINTLKNRMLEVNQMDQLIRKVADLEQNSQLFGVGGSPPEDLDPESVLPDRKPTQLIMEMHRHIDQLEYAVSHQHDSLTDLVKVVAERGDIMAYTPTIRPTQGLVSSRFGYRQSPFTDQLEFHNGLDIANRQNTEIIATANGRIAFAGERGGFGRMVIIDHGHGLTTRYAHLELILGERGDMVKRGEIIALMGNTGRSTGAHLHYEMRLNGVPVNPEKYFLN